MLAQAFDSAIVLNAKGQLYKPSGLPAFVISACCPFSEPLDDTTNLALHRSLQKRLQQLPGVSMEEVVGQSPDGSWKEISWAVTDISEEQAIDLGTLYCQWAIFRFDENGRTVLSCWQD